MTLLQSSDPSSDNTQRFYARLAGFLFLWLIVTGLTAMMITGRIVGSGPFAEQAKRVVASERLFRLAFIIGLVETMSALLLGFALYVVLKPVDKTLAQLALCWRVGESIIGCVGMVFEYARLRVYTSLDALSATGAPHAQALVDLTRYAGNATYTLSALSFSIASIIFFYLFYKSRYIPRALSAFGVFASVVVTLMLLYGHMFPEYTKTLNWGWLPMAIAEIVTGFWLMFGAKVGSPTERMSATPVLVHS